MDCFLADGIEVIFRLALALLLIGKNELLVQDMEGVIRVSAKKPRFFSIFVTLFLEIVLSKGDAHQVRVRPGSRLQFSVQHSDQPKEDEEAREGVHDHEDQRKGGRNRIKGKGSGFLWL